MLFSRDYQAQHLNQCMHDQEQQKTFGKNPFQRIMNLAAVEFRYEN